LSGVAGAQLGASAAPRALSISLSRREARSLFALEMSEATSAPTLELKTITPSVLSHGLPSRRERRLGGSLGIWTGGGSELGRTARGCTTSMGKFAAVGGAAAARATTCGVVVAAQGMATERRAASTRLVRDASAIGSAATGMSVVGRITKAGFVGSSSRGSTAGGKSRSESRFASGGGAAWRLRDLRRSGIADTKTCDAKFWSQGKNAKNGVGAKYIEGGPGM
jgi:hypothetical protein